MTNYAFHKHHLHWFATHYLTKDSCEISASSLKDFLSKDGKSLKTQELCIIMLIKGIGGSSQKNRSYSYML